MFPPLFHVLAKERQSERYTELALIQGVFRFVGCTFRLKGTVTRKVSASVLVCICAGSGSCPSISRISGFLHFFLFWEGYTVDVTRLLVPHLGRFVHAPAPYTPPCLTAIVRTEDLLGGSNRHFSFSIKPEFPFASPSPASTAFYLAISCFSH